MPPTCVVIGAGPGLGAAVARRFAREGFTVHVVTRKDGSALAAEIKGVAHAADTTDPTAVKSLFAAIGPVDVLVYNAGAFSMGSVLDIDPAQFEQGWKANCFGALLCCQQVLRGMIERKAGTVILTGATASLRGAAKFASIAVGKAGLRALAQSMARELGPQGVHVAHVVIDGQIDSAFTKSMNRETHTVLSPAAIAESYWQLHAQHPTAWTLELDLRPSVEKF